MFRKNNSTWTKVAVVAVVAAIALIIVSGVATASSHCKKVNGKLVLNAGGDTGSYSGDLRGNSDFTADGPASVTSVTNVFLLTGSNAIHTADGDLMTRDAIVLHTTGKFAEVDTVVDGSTGAWEDATGVIQATGKFTPGVGGEGDYIGEICTQ